jgi:hypothetical protein
VPRFAHRRLILFFWPMRASSWNQISISSLPTLFGDRDTELFVYTTAQFLTYTAGVNALQPSPNPNGTAENWGPEAEFSYRYRQQNPTRPLFMVKYAVGSTQLQQSADGLTTTDWSQTSDPSEYFGQVAGAIASAKSAIVALGYVPIVRAVIWMQGEQDAGLGGTATSQYQANLTALAAAVRTRWGDANTKFIIGRIFVGWGLAADNAVVRAAQVAVGGADVVRNFCVGNDASSFVGGHFTDAGAAQFGRDTWYAYNSGGYYHRIANGTFNTGTSSWSGQTDNGSAFVPDASVISQSSGTLLVTNAASKTLSSAIQQITGLVVGAQYRLDYDVTRADNPAAIYIASDSKALGTDLGGTGVFSYQGPQISTPTLGINTSFIAASSTAYVGMMQYSGATSGSVGFDNVSIIGP